MIKTGLYTLSIFLFFSSNQIYSESNTTVWEDIKDDAIHSFNVSIVLFKSPFTASSSDWQRIGIITAGTGLFFLIDPDIKELALRNQNKTNNCIFGVEKYFNKEYVVVYTSGMYLSGLLFRRPGLRRIGLYTIEAGIYSVTITEILKRFFGRSRPYTNNEPTSFSFFHGDIGSRKALPSGHATGAFSFCTVMAKSIDNNYWKTFWYGTAVFVSAARIYHNRHWLSDTVLGGFIGYTTASYIVHFDENKAKKDISAQGYSFQPYVNSSQIGLMIYF